VRAVVTGAGGFVGASLVRRLAGDGHEVHATVRPGAQPWRLADPAPPWALLELDLADPEATREAVAAVAPDWIFHLAAHGAYSWQTDLATMTQVNLLATEALLAAARDAGAALVNAGSSSEYGYKDHAPAEDELVEPNSHYAVTKAAGTHLCRLAAAQHGQRAVTLRLYSVYGPWEEPGRLMPTLVHHALDGRWPPLVAPDTARDFVWIDDVCQAFVLAATAPLDDAGAVLNIGSGRQTTLRELVETVKRTLGVEAEPAWGTMAQRGWDTSVWVADPGRAAAQLDWRARTPLEDGVARMAQWMRDAPSVAPRYAPTK
jgi:dolichol-phosphate mannosyltransferase